MTSRQADVVVIGAGIVGLSVARSLLRLRPRTRVVVVEKEERVAAHQSGHSSGVVHSGIYYRPGSLKARLATRGAQELERFAEEHGIPHERCGKVIVATSAREVTQLDALAARGLANGVPHERIGPERLRELEPRATGLAALHVPSTGIIDYVEVCRVLARQLEAEGGEVRLRACVTGLRPRHRGVDVEIGGPRGDLLEARIVVSCAGLHADRLAALGGRTAEVRIVPFRGEYYELLPARRSLVRSLIYPVPDPAFPFLGVHFTRRIGGGIECGPNAVLALAREGYRWRDVRWRDLRETLTYPGFWPLARRHWRTGVGEIWRSASKQAYVRALQRLVPEITERDLVRAPSGVRAQALRSDGALVDDFAIEREGALVHVLNAPSPAATASLAIGDEIASGLLSTLDG
jgi:(S)-2-hydroxyglutarate dehydrogenase